MKISIWPEIDLNTDTMLVLIIFEFYRESIKLQKPLKIVLSALKSRGVTLK